MANRRYSLVLVISLLVAAVATYMVYRVINVNSARNQLTTQAVVVASKDIKEGAEIHEADVRVEQWPEPVVPENAFEAAVRVSGRVSRVPIYAGEAIVTGKLAPEGAAPGLEARISPGKRAIGVRINDVSGMNGMVQPNSRVDILVTLTDGGTGETRGSKLFMENMRVLAMGSEVTRGADGRVTPSTVAMIEVTPDEAERLAAAEAQGQIRLVLRGSTDPGPSGITKAIAKEVTSLLRDITPAPKTAVAKTPPRTAPAPVLRVPESPAPPTQPVPAPPVTRAPAGQKSESLTVQVWRGPKRSDEKLTKDSVKRDTIRP